MKDFTGFKKGIDLGGWFSQCDHTDDRYENFIKKEDIEKAASWGIDHVRLPVDYNLFENAKGFDYLDRALGWIEECGLNVVIDLHKSYGFSFDEGENESGFFESEELQERFYKLWESIAERYGKKKNVAFELLNEVTEQSFKDVWNRIIKTVIGRIRVFAPETAVIVGGYWQNSPDSVKDLDAPYDDNVVYNIHCYDPLKFTHQGAYWVKDMPSDFRMSFEESGITAQYFIDRFKEAYECAKKNNTVLYCGEYGVIDLATPEDTVKWYKAINAAFVEYGIGRAAWSYKQMDFGLSDERMSGVIGEIIKYL